MSDPIPPVPVQSAQRSLLDRVTIVWLVPIIALLVALAVAWQSYSTRGPVIEIAFQSAAGVTKDETEIRFRDVAVGIVEDIRFGAFLDEVIVEVRLDPSVAPYVDEDAQFWVVSPEVSTQGVSGLDTVLSGVYIEGLWDEKAGPLVYSFTGLEDAPLLRDGQRGLTITLVATGGGLSGNTPLLYKGVEVGRIGPAMVADDGLSVTADAVIYSPYDNLVTQSTRFWDTSGFSVNLSAAGASVDFDSVASLIAGGVTFDTYVSGAPLAAQGSVFTLYPDQEQARASVFNTSDTQTLDLIAIFDGNVAGLTAGASVEYNGLTIGEVTGLNGIVEDTPAGGSRIRLQAILSIQPSRLGLEVNNTEEALAFLAEQVEEGLRAQLVTASLLTGGLKIQLTGVDGATEAVLDLDNRPFPRLPTTASAVSDVASSAQGTLERFNALPIDQLMQSAISFMDNASVLVGNDDTRAVPGDVRALIADVSAVVGADAVQALPAQLLVIMAELEGTVAGLNAILADVNERRVVASVAGAVESAEAVIARVDAALAGVPELVAEIDAVAASVAGLPLEDLVVEVTALSEQARSLIASEATQALPATLSAVASELESTLAQVATLVADLNEADAVTRLLAVVDEAGATAQTVSGSFDGLPALIDSLNQIAQDAQGLELDALIARVTDVVTSADTLLAQDTTQALPGELNAALAELRLILSDIREGGAVANTNAALQAVRDAADQIAAATDSLPALMNRANTLISQANTTLEGFEGTSPAIRDARDALREVQEAADAVQSLARALERSPLLR